LAHLPVLGGLAVPWITPRTPDGRFLLGTVDAARQHECLTHHRCGVCGRALDRPLVLLMRQRDLPRRCTSEPALDPVCAHYTINACPMVAGRLSHYRSSAVRLDHTTRAPVDHPSRLGAAAEIWFAVWLNTYTTIMDPLAGGAAASYAGTQPLKTRLITGRNLLTW
jgi:hypothetical protein